MQKKNKGSEEGEKGGGGGGVCKKVHSFCKECHNNIKHACDPLLDVVYLVSREGGGEGGEGSTRIRPFLGISSLCVHLLCLH